MGRLGPDHQESVRDRLRLGRELIGEMDPMRWFLGWRSPVER